MAPFVVLMLFITILIILALTKKVFLLVMATQKIYIKEKQIWIVEIEFF